MPESFDLICPEPDCGAPMKLRNSKYGKFYGCTNYPDCDSTHGAHPDDSPLGVPADKETRQARMRAHEAFDQLWRPIGAPYSKDQAYFEMRGMLSLKPDEAHIGMFDKERCEAMILKVNKRLARLKGEV